MQKAWYFLIFVCLLALTGCGKFSEKFSRLSSDTTLVNFSAHARSSGIHTNINLTFGVMIYAENADDPLRRASKFIAASDAPSQWALPNGRYNFYSVGWLAANMSGVMYCGRATNIFLNGTGKNIDLLMDDQGQCGLLPFAPFPGHSPSFPDDLYVLNVAVCDNATGNIALATGSLHCDAAGGRPAAGVTTMSFKYSLPEYDGLNGAPIPNIISENLNSGCINTTLSGTPIATTQKMPLGLPFVMKFKRYQFASCSTFQGSYLFGRGLFDFNLGSTQFFNSSDIIVNPALQSSIVTNNAGTQLYLRDI